MNGSGDLIELVALRRELHAHAELAGNEVKTGRVLRRFLEAHAPDRLVTELGGTGLAAVFEGVEKGPSLVFRAELDAVPVGETKENDYRSENIGVSHGCGHDGHMAIVAGLAVRLHQRPLRRGRVVLLFQPAEENGCGARAVLEDEEFRSLAPDWIFALHNLPLEKFGEVQIRSGAFTAGSVGVVLHFQGQSSHAAYPEQGRSPAAAVAETIQALAESQDSVDSADSLARITVVHVRVGEPAFGTTPGQAEVMATLRSDQDDILGELRGRVVELAGRVAGAHGLGIELSWTDEFPVTVNHPQAVALVQEVAESRGIAYAWRDAAYPWSEDFGWFTRQYRGAIFGLGAGDEVPPLHSPGYDFPEPLIPRGLDLFEGLIEKILG
jgi:amidohydrolase